MKRYQRILDRFGTNAGGFTTLIVFCLILYYTAQPLEDFVNDPVNDGTFWDTELFFLFMLILLPFFISISIAGLLSRARKYLIGDWGIFNPSFQKIIDKDMRFIVELFVVGLIIFWIIQN